MRQGEKPGARASAADAAEARAFDFDVAFHAVPPRAGAAHVRMAALAVVVAFSFARAALAAEGARKPEARAPDGKDSAVLVSPSWFLDDGSFIRRREEKVAVLSPENLRRLQHLIAERNAFRADMAALKRLSAEKTEALRAIDERFANEYGVRHDRRYSYDADKTTLFLVSTDPRHGGSAEKPALLPHRTFPTDEEAAAFLALMKAKEEAIAARNVFETALAERRE